DLLGGGDLHAQVVERSRVGGVLDEDERQRRGVDGGAGVALAALGRLCVEQRRVEGDGGVDVGDVEGELDTGHVGACPVTYGRSSMDRRAGLYRQASMDARRFAMGSAVAALPEGCCARLVSSALSP